MGAGSRRRTLAGACPLLETLRLSLTRDQGTEMASHEEIAHLFADVDFFAFRATLGTRLEGERQRVCSASTFPRRSDLAIYTVTHLAAIAGETEGSQQRRNRIAGTAAGVPNDRSRTVLGGTVPAGVTPPPEPK